MKKILFVILVLCLISNIKAQEKKSLNLEKAALKTVVQRYLDGMAKADHDLLKQVFYPTAGISRVGAKGELYSWAFTEWVNFVQIHPDYPQPLASSKIEKLEISGKEKTIALVKLQMNYRGVDYTEIISLLKISDEWRIMNKVFDGKLDANEK